MNVNKICAAVSALCFTGTAFMLLSDNQKKNNVSAVDELLGDVNRNGVVDAVDASTILSYYAYVSAGHSGTTVEQFIKMRDEEQTTTTSSQTTTAPQTTQTTTTDAKASGDKFTIAAYNADDYVRFVSTWLNVTENDVSDSYYSQRMKYDPIDNHPLNTLKTPSGTKLNIINVGLGSSEAGEEYERLFKSGEDIDVFFCDITWLGEFINNDSYTLPLSDLGFTDKDFSQSYKYADELSHNGKGIRKAAAPIISTGGFAYRTDLAKEYLGVNSPAEMQSAIGNWDSFIATAKKLSEASKGIIALADSVGGMYQAFSIQHQMTKENGSDTAITADAEAFAEYAKTLWDCGGVTKNYQWTDDWMYAGQKDKVMGYFISTWLASGGAFGVASENSEGKWELVQGPENFYWGGSWIAASPSTDNADDCASFIRSACIDKNDMLRTAKSDIWYLPNNKEAVAEILAEPSLSGMSDKFAFTGNDYLKVFVDTAENIKPVPLQNREQQKNTWPLLDVITHEYLERGKSLSDALGSFYNQK